MQSFPNGGGGAIVVAIAERIIENKAYLSEIDGLIGDGDHGVNMAKGFGIAAERLRGGDGDLSAGFSTLGEVLMGEIGGSMGPLYGMTFTEFADALGSAERVDPVLFSRMLRAGLEGVRSIGSAEVGDKTLIDAFVPAADAFDTAIAGGSSFAEALDAMAAAAERGRDSTIGLVARIGRAARLGERSRGVLDAGATSCALILTTLANEAKSRLSA